MNSNPASDKKSPGIGQKPKADTSAYSKKVEAQPQPKPSAPVKQESPDNSAAQAKQALRSAPVSEAVSLFLQSRPCHQMLEEYANKEYTLENLYFWRHIVEYRQMLEYADAETVKAHENLMLDLYIVDDARYELNLSYDMNKRMRSNRHNRDMWFEVQNEVAQLIRRGPYLRMAIEISNRVSKSWTEVLARASIAECGKIFYDDLFKRSPETRRMFKQDIGPQAVMLAEMIDGCVGLLVNLEQLIDVVVSLGERHRAYGTLPEHFKHVGEALMDMLREVLGAAFDKETERAWVTVYELMSTLMTMALDPSQVNKFLVEPPKAVGKKRDAKGGVKFEEPFKNNVVRIEIESVEDAEALRLAAERRRQRRNMILYPLGMLMCTMAGVSGMLVATDVW